MYFAQQIDKIDSTEIIQHLILLYFSHDYENICKILKLEYNSKCDKNVYKYNDNRMTFLKDENPITIQRIYVDQETKYILNTLLMITLNYINEKTLIDLI